MTPTLDLDTITLRKGSHASREDGMCAMEAAAYIAGEEHSDWPRCVCPVIAAFMRSWNDGLPSDEDRDRLLKPFLPRIIGTAGDGHDETRGWMALDWLVRVFSPAWLDPAGLQEHAQALRGLPEITAATRETWDGPLQERVSAARSAAEAAADAAAGTAALSAAEAAAYSEAYSAADAAADAAAGAAACSAVRLAARSAADAAAEAAADAAALSAYSAAEAAACSAARSAADAAAEAAADAAALSAYSAAEAAVHEVLAPVTAQLQASAVDLLDRMVSLGEDDRRRNA